MSDNVKNVFFQPGDRLRLSEAGTFSKPKSRHFVGREITVRSPARVHMMALDESSMTLENPGGGGLVFGTDLLETICTVTVTESRGIKLLQPARPSALHIARLFEKLFDLEVGLTIQVNQQIREHLGLGSTTMLLLATSVAINEAFDCPLSNRQLRRVLGYNYVEDSESAELVNPGYQSGCASVAGLYGGLTLVSDDLEIAAHMKFPDGYKVLLFVPNSEIQRVGGLSRTFEGEMQAIAAGQRFWPLINATTRRVFFELIPAMCKKDIRQIGQVIYDLNFMMGKIATIIVRYSVAYYTLFEKMYCMGADIVGLSSAGPIVYAIANEQILGNIAQQLEINGEVEELLGIGNISTGLKVLCDGKVKQYSMPDFSLY